MKIGVWACVENEREERKEKGARCETCGMKDGDPRQHTHTDWPRERKVEYTEVRREMCPHNNRVYKMNYILKGIR